MSVNTWSASITKSRIIGTVKKAMIKAIQMATGTNTQTSTPKVITITIIDAMMGIKTIDTIDTIRLTIAVAGKLSAASGGDPAST